MFCFLIALFHSWMHAYLGKCFWIFVGEVLQHQKLQCSFFSLLFPTLNNVNLTGKNLVILFCSFLLLALSFVSSNFISHLHFFCELFLVHACFSTWLLCFFTFAFVYKDYYILVMYSVFSLSSSALTIYSFPLACSITVCSSFIILSFFGSKLSHS